MHAARSSLAFAVIGFAAMLTSVDPAEARIVCRDGYQASGGQLIATPYCQDELVAQVAREHGMKVSGAAVRNNPNLKRNVCQFVGRDIRVQQACIDANSVGRRGF